MLGRSPSQNSSIYAHFGYTDKNCKILISASIWQHTLLKQLFQDVQAKYSYLISHRKSGGSDRLSIGAFNKLD
jgi:hypothetical protein